MLERTAPHMSCPICDRPLRYVNTVFGEAAPFERCDIFQCSADGRFEYSHNIGVLRFIEPLPKHK
jgi:hypothetical protein